jgi:co-chaperonin GroES (HSP10)
MKLLGDRVLLEPIEEKSGIIQLLKPLKKNFKKGKVLSIGDSVDIVKPGDIVSYEDYGTSSVSWEGKEAIFVEDHYLIAIWIESSQ